MLTGYYQKNKEKLSKNIGFLKFLLSASGYSAG